ncbi:MAG TPA: PA2779 family protein [Gammaproteobacteria bacterium]|nr:PA2779 family protein [Gammaproteobacteria bacterium]
MRFKILLRSLPIVFAVMTAGMPAQAGMVATAQIQQPGLADQFVDVSGQRDWIQARLLQGGVAQSEATARVAAMTDVEIAQIYQRVDEAPAGGNVLVIALVIFLVLEVTGYIDVIPEQ